jgi:hypothetical protein
METAMKTMLLVFVAALMATPSLALAQYLGERDGYTIITPGKLPRSVIPTPNGGYTVITPGRLPTFINPTPDGGYTVITPGKLPTFIDPTFPSTPGWPVSNGEAGGN